MSPHIIFRHRTALRAAIASRLSHFSDEIILQTLAPMTPFEQEAWIHDTFAKACPRTGAPSEAYCSACSHLAAWNDYHQDVYQQLCTEDQAFFNDTWFNRAPIRKTLDLTQQIRQNYRDRNIQTLNIFNTPYPILQELPLRDHDGVPYIWLVETPTGPRLVVSANSNDFRTSFDFAPASVLEKAIQDHLLTLSQLQTTLAQVQNT